MEILELQEFRFKCLSLTRTADFYSQVMLMNREYEQERGLLIRTAYQYSCDTVALRFEYDRSNKNNKNQEMKIVGNPHAAPVTSPLDSVALVVYVVKIEEFCRRCEQHGFEVYLPPTDVTPWSTAAVLIDPNGLKLRLLESDRYSFNSMKNPARVAYLENPVSSHDKLRQAIHFYESSFSRQLLLGSLAGKSGAFVSSSNPNFEEENQESKKNLQGNRGTYRMIDEEHFAEELMTHAWMGNGPRKTHTTVCLVHQLPRSSKSSQGVSSESENGDIVRSSAQSASVFIGLRFRVFNLDRTIAKLRSTGAVPENRLVIQHIEGFPRVVSFFDPCHVNVEITDGVASFNKQASTATRAEDLEKKLWARWGLTEQSVEDSLWKGSNPLDDIFQIPEWEKKVRSRFGKKTVDAMRQAQMEQTSGQAGPISSGILSQMAAASKWAAPTGKKKKVGAVGAVGLPASTVSSASGGSGSQSPPQRPAGPLSSAGGGPAGRSSPGTGRKSPGRGSPRTRRGSPGVPRHRMRAGERASSFSTGGSTGRYSPLWWTQSLANRSSKSPSPSRGGKNSPTVKRMFFGRSSGFASSGHSQTFSLYKSQEHGRGTPPSSAGPGGGGSSGGRRRRRGDGSGGGSYHRSSRSSRSRLSSSSTGEVAERGSFSHGFVTRLTTITGSTQVLLDAQGNTREHAAREQRLRRGSGGTGRTAATSGGGRRGGSGSGSAMVGAGPSRAQTRAAGAGAGSSSRTSQPAALPAAALQSLKRVSAAGERSGSGGPGSGAADGGGMMISGGGGGGGGGLAVHLSPPGKSRNLNLLVTPPK